MEKDIGEKRVISFHGVGLSVAPEIKFHEIAGSYENPDEVSLLNLLHWPSTFLGYIHSP